MTGLLLLALSCAITGAEDPAGPATGNAGGVVAQAIVPWSSTLYAGTTVGGLYRSKDGGAHWSLVEGALAGLFVSALAVDPTPPATLYAGTNGAGVFRSAGGDPPWAESNDGLANLFVEALVVDPETPGVAFAATDGGVFRTLDGGKSWRPFREGLTDPIVTSLVVVPGVLYAGTRASGVFRRDRGEPKWAGGRNLGRAAVRGLAVHPSAPATLYAATGTGIFRSTNAGETWSPANVGLTSMSILALAIDPASPARLYAATSDGLFRSSSGGADWSSVDTGSSGSLFNSIIFDGGGAVLVGGEGAVARSADGKSWTSVKLLPPPPAKEEP